MPRGVNDKYSVFLNIRFLKKLPDGTSERPAMFWFSSSVQIYLRGADLESAPRKHRVTV